MCGRTACTLAPDEICKSCSYRNDSDNGKGEYTTPCWRDHPGNHQYTPCHNMAPTTFSPVMILDQNLSGIKRDSKGENIKPQRIIQPMMWNLIPPYFKGCSATGHGMKTNNCRLETVKEKKSYIPSLKKGQRCVVLCDGFFEWQTTKGNKNKQPYFIYAPQPDNVSIWDRSTWDNDKIGSETDEWFGPQLLKLAGLYSKWTSDEGEQVMSYTVLTMESSEGFSWLHHRVPAILETEVEVQNWLDSSIGYENALANLKSNPKISYHPVSSLVNNSRNKDSSCTLPISLEEKGPKTASSKLMSAWLKSSTSKKTINAAKSLVEDKSQTGLTKWLNKKNSTMDSKEDSSNYDD